MQITTAGANLAQDHDVLIYEERKTVCVCVKVTVIARKKGFWFGYK